ncbi:type II toxin-antitoxin system PemK/MazF family toxin [Paenibacillus sp. ALE1]
MPAPQLSANPDIFNPEKIEKGMLFWYDFSGGDPSIITSKKIRPACVIGRTNRGSQRVIISPVSDIDNYLDGDKLKYPYHVALHKDKYSFVDKDSAILLDQVFTIPKKELYNDWFMGQIQDTTDLDNGLMYNYDLFQSVIDGVIERVSSILEDHKSNFSRK